MSTTWKIDPAHSEIHFKVKHLMITTVTGSFGKFEGEAVTEGDNFDSTSSITFKADVNSISTNNEQRDGHLKAAEFFDAEKFGEITFSRTRPSALQGDSKLQGDLTIKGITKPITLDIDFGGVAADAYGQTKAGFSVSGKMSRKEFGLTWNAVTETGNVVLGDEIKILGEIQLIKQAS